MFPTLVYPIPVEKSYHNYRMVSRLSVMILAFTFYGCCGLVNLTTYCNGELADYLYQPIPKIGQPLASTLSLEIYSYNTASSMGGNAQNEYSGGAVYWLPELVGENVEEVLRLDEQYSEGSTIAALNVIAKTRVDLLDEIDIPYVDTPNRVSQKYTEGIKVQLRLADEASRKGEYSKAEIHRTAATTRMSFQLTQMESDQAFARTEALRNFLFATMSAVQAIALESAKKDYERLNDWLIDSSGVIGPGISEDRHLRVIMFYFFDSSKSSLDSRERVAVMLSLIDMDGKVSTVLEGSDMINCVNKCNLFKPKPASTEVNYDLWNIEVKNLNGSYEGTNILKERGFNFVTGGLYQYILLHHALQRLHEEIGE